MNVPALENTAGKKHRFTTGKVFPAQLRNYLDTMLQCCCGSQRGVMSSVRGVLGEERDGTAKLKSMCSPHLPRCLDFWSVPLLMASTAAPE